MRSRKKKGLHGAFPEGGDVLCLELLLVDSENGKNESCARRKSNKFLCDNEELFSLSVREPIICDDFFNKNSKRALRRFRIRRKKACKGLLLKRL